MGNYVFMLVTGVLTTLVFMGVGGYLMYEDRMALGGMVLFIGVARGIYLVVQAMRRPSKPSQPT